MTGSQYRQAIPTKLSLEQFEQFVLPHLSRGRRGPAPTLALHTLFNYVLQMLYTGCQWKALAIKMNARGRPEIHYLLVVGLCLDLTGSVEWTVHAQSKSGRSPVREAVLRDVGRWLCRTAMQRT